jgi:hypothetical protein
MAIDADSKLIPSWIIGPRDGVMKGRGSSMAPAQASL